MPFPSLMYYIHKKKVFAVSFMPGNNAIRFPKTPYNKTTVTHKPPKPNNRKQPDGNQNEPEPKHFYLQSRRQIAKNILKIKNNAPVIITMEITNATKFSSACVSAVAPSNVNNVIIRL